MGALGLGKRLRAVAEEVEGRCLADVGCDHGKVSLVCLLEGKVDKVIACDISSKSLQKAIEIAKTYGASKIDFRVGDGLEVLNDNEADCVVIAGMGGNEIMSILSKNVPQGIKKIVLSPHRNAIELRKFLEKNRLYIARDYKVEECGKFYDIIVAEPADGRDCSLCRKELLLGKNAVGEDFDNYIEFMRKKSDDLASRGANSEQAKLYREIVEIADASK